MKFLIDAQLPAWLAELLNQAGHDAVHTGELPDGNRSSDSQIAQRADADGRLVVTKDRDFRDGHLLARTPKNTSRSAGIWSTNQLMRTAERELAEQAEASYKRMVKDQQAGAPARTVKVGASATPEHA